MAIRNKDKKITINTVIFEDNPTMLVLYIVR